MSYREIFVALILATWLVISACYAIFNERIARIIYRRDIFRLISAFQLFSGKTEHFRLSYRDMLADESLTAWEEVVLIRRWRLYHAIWFPQGMVPGYINSIADDLVRITRKVHPASESKPVNQRFIYHALFQYLKRYPQDKASLGRQFRIQSSENGNLFISDFYKA